MYVVQEQIDKLKFTIKKSVNRICISRAVVVHLNFQAGSTFPIPVCIVSAGYWVNKADAQ